MKFTKIAATAVALSTIAGSAYAADLPSRKAPMIMAPPPPVFTWSGFYVGLNAGGTFNNRNNFSVVAAPVANAGIAGAPAVQAAIDSSVTGFGSLGQRSGAILGAQAGYNWQFGSPFLLGIEADIQGIVQPGDRLTYTGTAPQAGFAAANTSSVTVTKRLDYLGTVRGRIGYVFAPNFMLYATGGLAYGQVKSQTSTITVATGGGTVVRPGAASLGINQGRVGYAVGAGGEWMFMPNWSLKAEYLYYDLRTMNYNAGALATSAPAGNPFTVDALRTRIRVDGHIARLGVNYHFWGASAAPVVARY